MIRLEIKIFLFVYGALEFKKNRHLNLRCDLFAIAPSQ